MNHTCTKHQPGITCYGHCGCRCDACRAAKGEAGRRYRAKHGDEVNARDRARYAGRHGASHHAVDLDEAAWLINMGESPEHAAAQLHTTPAAIAAHARADGRPELARSYEAARHRYQMETAA